MMRPTIPNYRPVELDVLNQIPSPTPLPLVVYSTQHVLDNKFRLMFKTVIIIFCHDHEFKLKHSK